MPPNFHKPFTRLARDGSPHHLRQNRNKAETCGAARCRTSGSQCHRPSPCSALPELPPPRSISAQSRRIRFRRCGFPAAPCGVHGVLQNKPPGHTNAARLSRTFHTARQGRLAPPTKTNQKHVNGHRRGKCRALECAGQLYWDVQRRWGEASLPSRETGTQKESGICVFTLFCRNLGLSLAGRPRPQEGILTPDS